MALRTRKHFYAALLKSEEEWREEEEDDGEACCEREDVQKLSVGLFFRGKNISFVPWFNTNRKKLETNWRAKSNMSVALMFSAPLYAFNGSPHKYNCMFSSKSV